jgi:hypothetical protein
VVIEPVFAKPELLLALTEAEFVKLEFGVGVATVTPDAEFDEVFEELFLPVFALVFFVEVFFVEVAVSALKEFERS